MNEQQTTIDSGYQGSPHTFALVQKEIEERFGSGLAQKYDAKSNCLTFRKWLSLGYRVKKGEKSIKSYTIIRDEAGDRRYFKPVHLFYFPQVEEIRK